MEKNLNIVAMSLITSCGCNLNCSYCRIAGSRNENSLKLQTETEASLQNGTFLKNIQDVLYKLKQSPSQIKAISFWGQEPTLTLHHITNNIKDWIVTFPGWKDNFFSTNTIANMDRIIDYIVALDNNLTHDFVLTIQLSYDGEFSTKNNRKADESLIYNNIKFLINELNKLNLKYVSIRMHLHAVFSLSLLNELNTYDDIYAYRHNLLQWKKEFLSINYNKKVNFSNLIDIGLENPVEATSEQGLKLAYICQIIQKIDEKECNSDFSMAVYQGAFRVFDAIKNELQNDFGINNLKEALYIMTKDPSFREIFLHRLNKHCFCGNGVNEIKIMYDGTLTPCQNHIFETDSNFINKNQDERIFYEKTSLVKHKYYINPLTDDEKDIEKWLNLFYIAQNFSFPFIFKTTITTMEFLLKAHQISPIYYNQEILIRHALLVSILKSCSYNNQVTTSSLFIQNTGMIRFICNGYLEQQTNFYNFGIQGEEII